MDLALTVSFLSLNFTKTPRVKEGAKGLKSEDCPGVRESQRGNRYRLYIPFVLRVLIFEQELAVVRVEHWEGCDTRAGMLPRHVCGGHMDFRDQTLIGQ